MGARIMRRYYVRSKARFPVAGAALQSIVKANGIRTHQVEPAHTATHWRWRTKSTARPSPTPRKRPTARRPKRNPSHGARLRRAVKLYRDFHGEEPKYIDEYYIVVPSHALKIGMLEGVIYSARMDGKNERFLHEFSGKSRPILAVSADGTQLLVLAGNYRMTDRGIVDGYAEIGE